MNTKRLGNLDWLEALSYDSPFERGQDPFGRAKAFCRAGAWVRLLECCLRVAVMVKLLSRKFQSLTELVPCSGSFRKEPFP